MVGLEVQMTGMTSLHSRATRVLPIAILGIEVRDPFEHGRELGSFW
jgi:hypothetical protein